MLEVMTPSPCRVCGEVGHQASSEGWCPICLSELPRSPWRVPGPGILNGVWVYEAYSSPFGALLRQGKYTPDPQVMVELGVILGRAARFLPVEVECVVPTPQSFLGSCKRGMSPVKVLARAVARHLSVPIDNCLTRQPGPPQASVQRHERLSNVLTQMSAHRAPQSRKILLLDDVYTSSATAQACAWALKQQGAAEVYLLAAISPVL